jgi:hypothetical protein
MKVQVIWVGGLKVNRRTPHKFKHKKKKKKKGFFAEMSLGKTIPPPNRDTHTDWQSIRREKKLRYIKTVKSGLVVSFLR